MSEEKQRQPYSYTVISLIIWAAISIPLLGYILWSDLQENYFDRGIRQGSQITAQRLYTDIIKKANNADCNTIYVEQDNSRVDLINIRCLRVVSVPSGTPERATASPEAPQNGSASVGEPVSNQD
ncbi:MAG: hypothetical protein GY934_17550 [Gammaproteobacteria bacterium]|nr:hypothetical protein [Gammaproteobacteria bacterium]